jgi:hypothetical protein
MRLPTLPILLVSAACDAPPEGAPGTPPDDTAGPGAVEPCGDDPPAIDSLAVLARTDDGAPLLVYSMAASDPDGALHFMTVRVWHDLVVDGVVDTSGPPTWEHDLDILHEESMAPSFPEVCEVHGVFPMSIGMRVEEEYGIPFGSPVEVALTVVDADGLESEPVLGDACVDTAEGEPGCD